MPTIPSWINQPNYLGAISSGANVGLQRAQMAQRAQEFQDELIQREAARNQVNNLRQQELAADALRRSQENALLNRRFNQELAYKNRALDVGAEEAAYKHLLDSSLRDRQLNMGYDRLNQEKQLAEEKNAAQLLRRNRTGKNTYLIGNTLYEKDEDGQWQPVIQGAAKEKAEKLPTVSINPNNKISLSGIAANDPLLPKAYDLNVETPVTNTVSHWFRPDTQEVTNAPAPGLAVSYLKARQNSNANKQLTSPIGSDTNAPVKLKSPQSGYKVGKVYGGLRYLGGDINDEANWEAK